MKIEVDKCLLKSLLILGSVIEARDAYTGGHTWRVAQFSAKLAERLGLSRSEIFVTFLINEDTFEAEFKNEKLFTVQPEIDLEQLSEITKSAPSKIQY